MVDKNQLFSIKACLGIQAAYEEAMFSWLLLQNILYGIAFLAF